MISKERRGARRGTFQLPTTTHHCEMSKLKVWSDSEIRGNHVWTRSHSGMRVHVRHAHSNKSQGYLMGTQTSPADVWLWHSEDDSLKDWSSKVWGNFPGAIKRSHCSGNEEDKLEQLDENDTYQRRNILIYYCVFMIPIPIISIPRIY